MIIEEENYIAHYGILRKSGRYPWNSGKDIGQPARNRSFLDYIEECKREGLSEKDISAVMEVPIAQIRDAKSIALNETRLANIHQAEKLSEKGMSNAAIAERMGLAGESSVRALLAPGVKERAEKQAATTNMLKEQVEKHGVIDVGRGVESHLNISTEKLRTSVTQLREQDYELHTLNVPQANGKETKMKVLAKPGITQGEIWRNPEMIKLPDSITGDDGATWQAPKRHPLVSVHPDRLAIRYGDEGGEQAEGVIYVRPGVPDLSLGGKQYAQVRVKVGDGHYLKGMAMYKEGLPKGTDLVFNTDKTREDGIKKGDAKLGVLKELEKDNPDYPFGSVVRQQILDEHHPTKSRVVSAMNIVNEEGNWKDWARNISAQALSKQSPSLAKEQLHQTYLARKEELDRINSLTNPVVKKKLLETYADSTDKSAVHLKAAALDRQNWHVILPIADMKPNEIYAPRYNHGESVVLIRYPHGGKFEIPELRVNNKHKGAREALGPNPEDAVGIHHSVAERLSGADFDGDTVLVIPNNSKRIKIDPALDGLKGFDAKKLYRLPDGKKSTIHTQTEMGKISNLITDMTLMGAPHHEIARAVRHSMVVIDAAKHDLDHKRSAQDNAISKLKEKYQGGPTAGASTIISRAKSELRIDDRKPRPYSEGGPIDKETGELRFVRKDRPLKDKAGNVRVDKNGNTMYPQIKSTKLAEAKDAHELVSVAGTRVEKIYADHSNRLKSLANQSRLSMINQPKWKTDPSAKRAYAPQVESLNAKLALAKMNAPRERQAQIIANKIVSAEKAANTSLDANSIKKIKFRALTEARNRMGVEGKPIEITKHEWAAIQAGAISENVLSQILDKADMDIVQRLATPRNRPMMSRSNTALAISLLAQGRTRAEVAQRLGVSVPTLDAAITGDAEDDDDE